MNNYFRVLVQEKKYLSVSFVDVPNKYEIANFFYSLSYSSIVLLAVCRNCEVASAMWSVKIERPIIISLNYHYNMQ